MPQAGKETLQVERTNLTSKLVTGGEMIGLLPRSLKLLFFVKESRKKPPMGFLNPIPPALGKLLPNCGNRPYVRLDF